MKRLVSQANTTKANVRRTKKWPFSNDFNHFFLEDSTYAANVTVR